MFNNFIQLGQNVKLSFISYMNSNFFKTDKITSYNNTNCDNSKYVTNNVISIHPVLSSDTSINDLVTIVFDSQPVKLI